MKIYLSCIILSLLGVFAAGMRLGFFGEARELSGETPEVVSEKKPAAPRAKFPEALAAAVKSEPVAVAAAFEPGDRPHKMVFLDAQGAVHAWHPDHEGYHEAWWTERVEEAELVVVVGKPRKLKISHHLFAGGAPPITRYQFELEATVIEAKSGKILAQRQFQNLPRPIRPRESWETTALGAPVSYHTVFRWAAGIAKFGPPAVPISTPIAVQLKD